MSASPYESPLKGHKAMFITHKVVRISDMVAPPSHWQLGADKEVQFASALETALDKMAAEGWEFVGSYGGVGSGYFIFRQTR